MTSTNIKFTRDSKEMIEDAYKAIEERKRQNGDESQPTMYEVLLQITDVLIDKYGEKEKVYTYQLKRKNWESTGNILKCIELYYEKNNLYDTTRKIK